MRRWDLEYKPGNYVGAGDSVLVPRNGGDWVDYDDHLAELRQTQRRMIAALYWRAGAIRLACHTHPYASPMWWGSIADSDAILAEAVRMEAACAR